MRFLTARLPLLACLWRSRETAMVVLRRILIVGVVAAAPVVIVALMYLLSVFVLQATQRTIDPQVLRFASAGEYVAFLFLALVEARNRW
jgi:flagellar biosynthesis protein FliQ